MHLDPVKSGGWAGPCMNRADLWVAGSFWFGNSYFYKILFFDWEWTRSWWNQECHKRCDLWHHLITSLLKRGLSSMVLLNLWKLFNSLMNNTKSCIYFHIFFYCLWSTQHWADKYPSISTVLITYILFSPLISNNNFLGQKRTTAPNSLVIFKKKCKQITDSLLYGIYPLISSSKIILVNWNLIQTAQLQY